MIPDGDVDEVTECLHTYKYNCSSGPLWCARLLQATHSWPRDSLEAQLQPDFPHCYYLLFGFHHVTGDAASYIKLCGTLVSLLDDVIGGRDINDEDQIGNFIVNEEFDQLKQRYKEAEVEKDTEQKQTDEKKLDWCEEKTSILADILQVEDKTERKTLLITQTWDSSMTSQFFKKCKQEGVTIHSGFTALAKLALADFLSTRGVIRDSYQISSKHLVSVRRYWESDSPLNLCCYTALLPVFINIPSSLSKSQFWDLARSINENLQNSLKADQFLRPRKKLAGHQFDVTFNNIGDVTATLSRGGPNVQAASVVRSATIHNLNIIWDHGLQTFKGRLIHSLKYNSGIIPSEAAQEYLSRVHVHLHEII